MSICTVLCTAQPIPYWLYKLHGLNISYTCEICGNHTYRGPKVFQRHFAVCFLLVLGFHSLQLDVHIYSSNCCNNLIYNLQDVFSLSWHVMLVTLKSMVLVNLASYNDHKFPYLQVTPLIEAAVAFEH